MSETNTEAEAALASAAANGELVEAAPQDVDPVETQEWLDSLAYVLSTKGAERVRYLLTVIENEASEQGVNVSRPLNTPYINTIPKNRQPRYPGNRELERRIKSIIRWNAMAMVHRANKHYDSLGGHISTFASSATLYEVGYNHCFRGRGEDGYSGDLIYFQGHASPGMYSRAFLEGRLSEANLEHFRRELQPHAGPVVSYPHPWLMPDVLGIPHGFDGARADHGHLSGQASIEYLQDRGVVDTTGQKKVWAFLGDGECDEPESLGAITLAGREKLDNLIFVVNCNLQRLDGPVRGNGKIIQELEGLFRGAGWNVHQGRFGVTTGTNCLERDETGLLAKRME